MTKALKLTLLLMGIIFGVFFLFPLVLPSQIEVTMSKEINAPQKVVFEQISDLQHRLQWTPFIKDSAVIDSISNPSSGKGAKDIWFKGDTITRSLTIIQSKPYHSVDLELWFPHQHGATEKWTLSGDSLHTKVTWHFKVLNLRYPFGRWLGLMLKGSLKPMLKLGLDQIGKAAVKEEKEKSAADSVN
jgi:hypothetical protein